MSRLSSARLSGDVVHLALFPGEAVLARSTGRILPTVAARARYAGPPLAALDEALQDARWRAAALRVVVSNQFLRYAVLPADPGLSGVADELALAEARFRQVHGAQADLEVRLSDPLSGRPQVAAGFPRDLRAGLQERFARAGLRLVSLEPLFMRAMAQARPREGGFWLASAEPGALLLARHDPAGWSGISVGPSRGALPAEIGARLREARLLSPEAPPPATLYVHAPAAGASAWPGSIEGVAVRVVRGRKGVEDAALGV